jgi:deoxycytidylate deaminase
MSDAAPAVAAPPISGPEIFVGIVSPIGLDNDEVCDALERALERVDYECRRISLIAPALGLGKIKVVDSPLQESYHGRMSAGDEFRKLLKRNDALALGALAEIRTVRRAAVGKSEKPLARTAFILRSLKTPDEVATLRTIYGSNFVLIAAYSPRERRAQSLASRIAETSRVAGSNAYLSDAYKLLDRDEREHGTPFGQNLNETFPLADVFVNAADRNELGNQMRRFVELVFGHPFQTPYRDEAGMFQAYAAALRSSSAARQVGAAIATRAGDVVSIGANEVPKAFGGQYWADDSTDQRDHMRTIDASRSMVLKILSDSLARLKKRGWLTEAHASRTAEELLQVAEQELSPPLWTEDDDPPSLKEKAYLFNLLEFLRAVHAEMAALMCAARQGTAVDGCTLYTTTFPCHECARHIVAAGIERVVFVEPYPKSRALDLYDDSIEIDGHPREKVPFEAYVGVAPRAFIELFNAPKRRGADRRMLDWERIRRGQVPRYARPASSYLDAELDHVDLFNRILGVSSPSEG